MGNPLQLRSNRCRQPPNRRWVLPDNGLSVWAPIFFVALDYGAPWATGANLSTPALSLLL
jgi:hypothetical protein